MTATEVEAAVSTALPVLVLLGEDVPELQQLIGSKARNNYLGSEDIMVVVTRVQAKKQLEDEIIRREQKVSSGAQPSPVEGLGQSREETSHTDTPQEGQIPLTLTQEQRHSLRQQMGKQDPSTGDKKSVADNLELSAGELRELQEEGDTLVKIREAADGHANSAGVGFFKRDGFVYWRWTPPGRGKEYEIEQLVIPKACRKAVLE